MLGSAFEGVNPIGQLVFGAIAAAVPVINVLTAVGLTAAIISFGFLLTLELKSPPHGTSAAKWRRPQPAPWFSRWSGRDAGRTNPCRLTATRERC
ncbi:hypothetical protein GCM10025857_14100 [Alicyclobacillus contaminans]|uniref:hypothetical protein n=1 Tax=Alicyclobacillus contaminans TaxID=392016 RepID=UPI00047C68BA|nr:hypothetical protein [Alicyclobacillus contaminans]GMA50053.1 hypothetical protein GCM10025857_14100 [Alicyclobacillus contaminans]